MELYEIRNMLNLGISLSNINLRVTYYSRVSTDHLEQINSLNNQIDYFEEMIKNNKNWIYMPGYIDEGISGTTDYKREKFMQMINDAHENRFDLIITKEISRFSRNTLDSIKYTRELLECGVAVLFLNDNINTALPDSELRLTIMASMAQDEIRRLSERVKFGMKRAIKKGNILGNNMLYGYKKDKLTGNLIIIKDEALIVKRIFSFYAMNNYSINKIVNILNRKNIKTRQNKNWCVSTITRMIKNPKYKGYYCGGKSEVIDYMTKKVKRIPESEWIVYKNIKRIPQIIDENLWNIANKKINRNKYCKHQNRYPLSSKIYCDIDNSLYYRRIQKNDTVWICSKHLNNGKNSCNNISIKENHLLRIIDSAIELLNIDLSIPYIILMNYYNCDVLDKISIINTIIDLLINKIIVNNESIKILINISSVLKDKVILIENKQYYMICESA